ncbi:hypothetical protein [Nocardia terpenica]|uniref:MFS transporter n=1 Tax=Nocardia terpenica TaxID=455432 RepID=A0A164J9J6_9NOCA|nr:hypothetical protein [Nocardia terpenica]KZM70180.1 hypothetical protein AWN90_06400 [Nocardia terpenica]NQE91609.1 hypothetical protein [Nocardia terpenica]
MSVLGVLARCASVIIVRGTPFPLPSRAAAGIPLAAVDLLIAMPRVWVVVALVGRGYATDRFGAREAVFAGPTAAFVATALCILTTNHGVQGALLLVASMGTANMNGASAGWFPPDRRGVALGIVQASQRWSCRQSLRRTDFPARSAGDRNVRPANPPPPPSPSRPESPPPQSRSRRSTAPPRPPPTDIRAIARHRLLEGIGS